MKKSTLLLVISILVRYYCAIPAIAQRTNTKDNLWDIHKTQLQERCLLPHYPDIPVNTPHHPSLPADEVTTLNPIIPDFKVNDDEGSADQGYSSIATDGGGNFVITWLDARSDAGFYAQRYLRDGTAVGRNFKVDDNGRIDEYPQLSIAMDKSGNFMITWKDYRNGDSDIYAQQYLNDGTTMGGNLGVNDDEGNAEQRSPSITAYGNGNFIITLAR